MIHVNPATMSTLWASNTSGFVVAADRSELLRQIGRRAAERLFFCRNDVRRALMELLEKHFPGAARTWRAPPASIMGLEGTMVGPFSCGRMGDP